MEQFGLLLVAFWSLRFGRRAYFREGGDLMRWENRSTPIYNLGTKYSCVRLKHVGDLINN